jgi:hypothetical protein
VKIAKSLKKMTQQWQLLYLSWLPWAVLHSYKLCHIAQGRHGRHNQLSLLHAFLQKKDEHCKDLQRILKQKLIARDIKNDKLQDLC